MQKLAFTPVWLGFLAVLLFSERALATVMMPVSIEDMSKEAVSVVRAQVKDTRSAWDDAHRRIYTFVDLQILEVVAGSGKVDGRITVRKMGGEVGDIGMKVAGTPQFATAEEVLVFLRKDPLGHGRFQVIGMSQGKFRVVRKAGLIRVVPSLEGIAFATKNENGLYEVDPQHPDAPSMSWAEMIGRIHRARQAAQAPTKPATPTPTLPNSPSAPDTQTLGQ